MFSPAIQILKLVKKDLNKISCYGITIILMQWGGWMRCMSID